MRLQEFFVEILSDPAFEVVARENCRICFGRPGVRWHGTLNGLLVFVSESATMVPSTPSALARILAGEKARLDRTKRDVYFAPKRAGTGIRIEFRYDDRWFEIWSPDHLQEQREVAKQSEDLCPKS
jgi:hypothetical protein